MKLKNVTRTALVMAMTASFIVPQVPSSAFAATNSVKKTAGASAADLFPEDTDGLFPTVPTIPSTGTDNSGNKGGSNNSNNSSKDNGNGGFVRSGGGNGGGNNNGGASTATTKPQSTSKGATMATAKVAEAYACPLFDNRPHAELIQSIDSLMTQVKASQECSDNPSVGSIEANTKSLKDSINAMKGMLDADPTSVNAMGIEQNVTAAAGAINNIGEVLNNSSFLNSACGRQTMSTGRVLLSLNDIINGFAPFALFASVMNPAIAPVMIGATIASTTVKVVANMFDQGSLDMTNPNHRLAVLQNTCQFTKVAKKVRFMQLAQSGKIEKVTQEMEKSIDLYKASINKPSKELTALLKYRQTVTNSLKGIEDQLSGDSKDMTAVITQMRANNDDLMVCTLSRELVNWAQDGKTFPASAFTNLQAAANTQNERSTKLQAATFQALHASSMKRVVEFANQAATGDENALKACAQTGRSWITGMGQAVTLTNKVVTTAKTDLENELRQNTEYRQFTNYFNQIAIEKTTVERVTKAMEELAKDTSIIDRSELAQRMTALKSGLFGTRKVWNISSPPVLQWIDHTKLMHDRAVSAFLIGFKGLQNGAFSLTRTAQGKAVIKSINGGYITDTQMQVNDMRDAQALKTLNLANLPAGSLNNERACQQLEGAWLDWSASVDHLGAIQFFCDMIDPVLDVKMDNAVVLACRGNTQLSGKGYIESTVNEAKKVLAKKGYRDYANLISAKLKELQCPVPAISVMNE